MEIKFCSHGHPLVLAEEMDDESPKNYCFGCEEAVEGSSYSCGKCIFFLHKNCAQLPVAMFLLILIVWQCPSWGNHSSMLMMNTMSHL
ncbi:hypothetical protein SLEP1_g519 [Rubroshorea leprosula]|uniref:DC1 domain-containing protein n=1 Tax=Rubroshorea leprosula TaxID=152421 RepID=A0AAV5HJR6_9ROSI|nr:hypothetical protein SLEP1_g519 [Rubroshorea leprosula]